MKRNKKLPIWLRRLDLVAAELKTVRFPATAQEGFRQCEALSKAANRLLLQSLREQNPGAGAEAIERARLELLARFSAAEARHIKRWKRERDRYFRS